MSSPSTQSHQSSPRDSTSPAQTAEDGFGTIEYIGISVVIAVIIGGLALAPWSPSLKDGTRETICVISTGDKRTTATGECLAAGVRGAPPAEPAPPPSEPDASEDRLGIIERANFWVQQPVPYSMEQYTEGPDGKLYRTDCSGFVSMAWGLDTSHSTVTLPSVSHPIPKDDLQPGDILLKGGPGTAGADGHVVIFNGWTDESRTSYHGIEQAGGTGTIAREISYPYNGDGSYLPYRKN